MSIFTSIFLGLVILLTFGPVLLSRNKFQLGQKTNPTRLVSLVLICTGLFVAIGKF